MQGWVKLHRNIMESTTFKTLTLRQKMIAIYLILNANHEDGIWTDRRKGLQVNIKRGQLIISPQKIADEWFKEDKEITRQVVRTALSKLEKLNFLTKHTTNDYTLINIVNYGVYQDKGNEGNQQDNQALTKRQPSVNQALTTNKNVKNNKEDIYSVFDHWNEKGIIRHRKLTDTIKKTISARLKDGYSLDEILKAIDNYETVLNSDFHFFSHKWVLKDFLNPRNLDRFLDENKPLDIWRKAGAPKERPKPPKNETREEMRMRLLKEAVGNAKLVL